DNTDIDLEGAKSALPIWTEFMKKAMTFRAYRNPAPFEPVDGIVTAEVDPQTQELATVNCPERRMDVFIAGTQPAAYCRVHGGRPGATPLLTTVAGWDTDSPDKAPPASAVVADAKPAPTAALPTQRPRVATRSVPIPPEPSSSPSDQSGEKKGLFRRIWDALK
ncbi:MAG TPA: penicillin-binding protein 1A, partial [Bryobacterales bacterium]|nr:penicillin-binding protein 1A [Bryobacterales bacterium]